MTAGSPLTPSDDSFRKGLDALERRQYQQAISLIQEAIDLERQDASSKNPRMRYLSYLGLALTLAQERSEEGLKLCEQAMKRDFFDADLFCNLGIVYLRNRQKAPAFDAFRKGLALKPRHARIREELERHERREHPFFRALPRGHFLNRMAGQVRFRLRLLLQRFHRAPVTSD